MARVVYSREVWCSSCLDKYPIEDVKKDKMGKSRCPSCGRPVKTGNW